MDFKKKKLALRYLSGFCIPFVIFLILLLPNILVLHNSGEFTSEKKISSSLIKNKKCIFGTATGRAKLENIKLEIYKAKKPDVIAFGSSIATQFKDIYFNKSFYNMGGIVPNLTKAEELSRRINEIHTPKIVIFTIDFWWFHETSKGLGKKVATYKSKWLNDFKNTFLPFNWVWTGKISFEEYFNYLVNKNNCRFGMLASKKQQGFIHDGSYFHGLKYFERTKRDFESDLKNLEISSSHYRHLRDIETKTLARFNKIINFWNSKGSKLLIVTPPLAPQIYEEIQNNYKTKLNLLKVLRNHLETQNIKYFYLQNPNLLELSDCDFLDGRHLTEISAMKVLHFLYKKQELNGYINDKYLSSILKNEREGIISKKKLQEFYPKNSPSDLNDKCFEKNNI